MCMYMIAYVYVFLQRMHLFDVDQDCMPRRTLAHNPTARKFNMGLRSACMQLEMSAGMFSTDTSNKDGMRPCVMSIAKMLPNGGFQSMKGTHSSPPFF